MRVLRIYHGGRDPAHRERDVALAAAGIDLTLVVPAGWPDSGAQPIVSAETFEIVELPVRRAGDIGRWAWADPAQLAALVGRRAPDLLDLHAEPFSTVVHQLRRLLPDMPAVGYTAQNIDKRFPPPFTQRERAAFGWLRGLYPCSNQAASVAAGKGYAGPIEVVPLGWPPALRPGDQQPAGELQLALLGRLEPGKGVRDAVRLLATVHAHRPARLTLVGRGTEAGAAQALADELGVGSRLRIEPWAGADALADIYATSHVVLVPSLRTARWVEQFGRVVVEAQACGAIVAGYGTGSLPEVVGTAGLLAAEGDHAGLARRLLALADDQQAWNRLREQGFAAAAASSWPVIAQTQLSLYRQALVAGPPAPPVVAGRTSRQRATARFGPPAEVAGGGRPYALPLLRRNGPVIRAVARTQDTFTESVRRGARAAR